jgi:hypothetical protein
VSVEQELNLIEDRFPFFFQLAIPGVVRLRRHKPAQFIELCQRVLDNSRFALRSSDTQPPRQIVTSKRLFDDQQSFPFRQLQRKLRVRRDLLSSCHRAPRFKRGHTGGSMWRILTFNGKISLFFAAAL